MPEYRQNPLSGDWVVLSPVRGKRPRATPPAPPRPEPQSYVRSCDFCPGHERRTPPEVFAVRDDHATTDGEGWKVRVFANKFPAVTIDAEGVPTPESIAFKTAEDRLPAAREQTVLRVVKHGVGIHEVLVESPRHDVAFVDQPPEQARLIVEALRHRFRLVMQARDVKYVCLFKNDGVGAGITVEHPHFQLLAPAILPPLVGRMVERQESYAKETGRAMLGVMLEEELASGRRIVASNDEFVALCPWAPQFAYETWIIPRERSAFFGELPGGHVELFAAALRETLARLRSALNDPDYNLVIHSGPKTGRAEAHAWWFVRIAPRVTGIAGFEIGSGVYLNPTPPEDAAALLREARGPHASPEGA